MYSSSIQHEAMQGLKNFQEYMKDLLLLKTTKKPLVSDRIIKHFEVLWSMRLYDRFQGWQMGLEKCF